MRSNRVTQSDIGSSRPYKTVSDFLKEDSFTGFTQEHLFIKRFIKNAWGQDIAALSNMAEAIAGLYALELIDDETARHRLNMIVSRALHKSVRPYSRTLEDQSSLGLYGYYLEHLNIILGHFQAAGDNKQLTLNERITVHLRDLSLKQSNVHAPLLPHVRMRWSADQAAIIHSIHLFDQNNGTTHHEALADRWLSTMKQRFTHQSGLFQTEVMNCKAYSKEPRGCAGAYLIYYMSAFAPETAKQQWTLYKHNLMTTKFGVTGVREYLPAYRGRWTPDSGPIISGIGVAASGLALKTAARVGDLETYDRIARCADPLIATCHAIQPIPLLGIVGKIGSDLLASSVRLTAQVEAIRDRSNSKECVLKPRPDFEQLVNEF